MLLNFFAGHSHIRREKSRGSLSLASEDSRPEAFEPPAIRNNRIGLEPMFQLKEVGRGNSSLPESLDQMIENALRRRSPNLRHSLSSSVLLMENEAFKLIG